MIHYRVNVNHYSSECFCHFDSECKMFEWISERIGEEVSTFEDCEAWTRRHDDESYIEILVIENLKTFFINRRDYVTVLSEMRDMNDKISRMPFSKRRNRVLNKFSIAYDIAHGMVEISPEIWQGEI